MKLLQVITGADESRYDPGAFPEYVFVMTQAGCNARCVFCPNTEDVKTGLGPRGRMSFDLFKKIVDECGEHHPRRFAPFLNNEPLADKRLPELVAYARSKLDARTEIMLISNGSLMTKEMFRGLADAGLDRVKISVQGVDAETYHSIMKLDFDRTISNIHAAADFLREERRGKPKIEISTVVTKATEGQIRQIKKYWRKHGIKASASPCTNYGGNVHETKENHPLGLYQETYCKRLHRECNIDVHGHVILCCYDWYGQVRFGDVNTRPIAEIWRGPVATTYRNVHRRGEASELHLCGTCYVSKFPARQHTSLKGIAQRMGAYVLSLVSGAGEGEGELNDDADNQYRG